MPDLLEYVRRRREVIRQQRARLDREEAELDVVERHYQASQSSDALAVENELDEELAKHVDYRWAEYELRPANIKDMVLRLLREAYPDGLTAGQVLIGIRRSWKPDIERTSLSPQLTRLKNKDKKIRNAKTKWFLVRSDDDEDYEEVPSHQSGRPPSSMM